MRIEAIIARPFPIALKEPFTISRASVGSTRAVLVRATVSCGDVRAEGLGEAALPLGDGERPEDLVVGIHEAGAGMAGVDFDDAHAISTAIDHHHRGSHTARAGLSCALFDGLGRLTGRPLYALFGASGPVDLVTDITLPIADPAHLADLARGYWQEGFRCFKVKVGADLESDRRTVALVAQATPGASLRLDANEGFAPQQAVALVRYVREHGLDLECFEQPCARHDLDGMRRVREEARVPVVADEAVRDARDVERLVDAGAADGINLKLVKMGGIDRCVALGRLARQAGLRLMVGAMIESRLGLTAMAHVASALGGVDWVDLDTAFLLARDPFRGGMKTNGPRLSLPTDPGLGMETSE